MPGEQLVEQLAGLADERQPLLVLVEAGRLADEHQVCVRVPDAEDDLSSALCEPAAGAGRDLFAESVERVHAGESRDGGGQFSAPAGMPPSFWVVDTEPRSHSNEPRSEDLGEAEGGLWRA